jgi:hypothetical protein
MALAPPLPLGQLRNTVNEFRCIVASSENSGNARSRVSAPSRRCFAADSAVIGVQCRDNIDQKISEVGKVHLEGLQYLDEQIPIKKIDARTLESLYTELRRCRIAATANRSSRSTSRRKKVTTAGC